MSRVPRKGFWRRSRSKEKGKRQCRTGGQRAKFIKKRDMTALSTAAVASALALVINRHRQMQAIGQVFKNQAL
jgi:hypothetical protein